MSKHRQNLFNSDLQIPSKTEKSVRKAVFCNQFKGYYICCTHLYDARSNMGSERKTEPGEMARTTITQFKIAL